ncbi:type III secretion system protein SpaM [Serratia fonticola]|uniref:Type III secretion system protein SpaM n=2 Tax=Serratia fonticola TaxID=47917 RepID=A0A0F7D2K8_SERFO|nr:hypothetical protein WN53_18260 [Serratia fonticola]VTR36763.1 type III secretion system protein SpaM [Serratia fonticola]
MLLDREMKQIQQSLLVLGKERQSMKGLLRNMAPQGENLDRAALYSSLRKQSVIRRRISNLELDQGLKQQELASREKEKASVMTQRKQFYHQADKYKNLQQHVRKETRAALARQEESEVEEIIVWKK